MAALAVLAMAAAILPAPARADGPGLPGTGFAASGERSWGALAGGTLRGTLDGWSGAAGWTLIWDTEYDYALRASAQFRGSFEAAVIELVDSVHRSNPELAVTLYRGNRVVHVTTTLAETR